MTDFPFSPKQSATFASSAKGGHEFYLLSSSQVLVLKDFAVRTSGRQFRLVELNMKIQDDI
jgi:hypothetical protein